MKRVIQVCAVALVTAVWSTGPASALSPEVVFQRCAETLKKEFGEAEVEFKKFRRNGDREMAFGELQMTDGTTHEIRCRVRHGRRIDVGFRTDEGTGNNAWSADRPENAGFIEPEETAPAAPADPAVTGQQNAAATPTQTPNNDTTQSGETDTAAVGAPQTTDPNASEAQPAQPNQTGETDPNAAQNTENAENPEGEAEKPEENAEVEIERKPRFMKAPKR